VATSASLFTPEGLLSDFSPSSSLSSITSLDETFLAVDLEVFCLDDVAGFAISESESELCSFLAAFFLGVPSFFGFFARLSSPISVESALRFFDTLGPRSGLLSFFLE
jgi:hypothetical protein